MREKGIKAIWISPQIRTTIDPDFDNKLTNILNREFNPTAPNRVWVTDITYIYTLEGFVYLTSVMDLYSRRIVGWNLSDSLHTESVIKAINKAKQTRTLDNPVVVHSDRGTQFTSTDYKDATPENEFIRSYSRKGNPWDNACMRL